MGDRPSGSRRRFPRGACQPDGGRGGLESSRRRSQALQRGELTCETVEDMGIEIIKSCEVSDGLGGARQQRWLLATINEGNLFPMALLRFQRYIGLVFPRPL